MAKYNEALVAEFLFLQCYTLRMQSFIHNLKNQSFKSIFLATIISTLVLYIYLNFGPILSFLSGDGYGFPLFLSTFFQFLVSSLIYVIFVSLLISKKGLLNGLYVGIIIAIIFLLPAFSDAIFQSSFLSVFLVITVVFFNLVKYALPAAVLGYFRRN